MTLDNDVLDMLANASKHKPAEPAIPRESSPVIPAHLWEETPAHAGPPKDNRKPQQASQAGESMTLDQKCTGYAS